VLRVHKSGMAGQQRTTWRGSERNLCSVGKSDGRVIRCNWSRGSSIWVGESAGDERKGKRRCCSSFLYLRPSTCTCMPQQLPTSSQLARFCSLSPSCARLKVISHPSNSRPRYTVTTCSVQYGICIPFSAKAHSPIVSSVCFCMIPSDYASLAANGAAAGS
jgi:hypothetical protein